MNNDYFREIELRSFPELRDRLFSYDSGFVFRGHRDCTWNLESTLTRLLIGIPDQSSFAETVERTVKDLFKSRLHHYIHKDLEPLNDFGWLSLAQHHGAPTRFLDFTQLPLVALYFAIQGGGKVSSRMAIWVLNYRRLNQISEKIRGGGEIDADPDGFFQNSEKIGRDAGLKFCWVGEPRRLNLRLERQGGTFLIPSSAGVGISEGLASVREREDIEIEKLVFGPELLDEAFEFLEKAGVTASRLFDGVDGLAKEVGDKLGSMVTKLREL